MKRTNGTAQSEAPTNSDPIARLQALTELATRLSLSARAGFSHNNERDLYKTLGYPQKVTPTDLISRWKRQDIARAIVDRPVKTTWRGDVGISENTEEDITDLEKAYTFLDNKLGLKRMFMRVDRLAQLGQYAVILLGFDDSATETWGQPVENGERELRYLRVVSETNADISTWETDPSNERYGLPRLYKIKLKHPGETEKTSSLTVHYTRIIHVAPDLLENEVEGEPILTTAYNRLMDLEKLIGGSAEMFWRGARPGYQGKADPDYKVDDDVKDKMQEQIQEYENDLRRFMIMEGVDLESLAQQIADPKGHVEVQLKMISALTGIPLRILLGSERGKLASSSDDDNWKSWVHDRRLEMAEPTIVRPFIDRMIEVGVFPEAEDADVGYQVSWPDLFTLGEKEKAEVGQQRANSIANYAKEPAAEQMVPLEPFLTYVLRMNKDEVTHILEQRKKYLSNIMEEEDELTRTAEESATEPNNNE